MKRLFLLPLLLIGCKPRIIYHPVEVKVPVVIPAPKINIPPRPRLPKIEPTDSPSERAKKMAEAYLILMEYELQLRKAIEAYEQ